MSLALSGLGYFVPFSDKSNWVSVLKATSGLALFPREMELSMEVKHRVMNWGIVDHTFSSDWRQSQQWSRAQENQVSTEGVMNGHKQALV